MEGVYEENNLSLIVSNEVESAERFWVQLTIVQDKYLYWSFGKTKCYVFEERKDRVDIGQCKISSRENGSAMV